MGDNNEGDQSLSSLNISDFSAMAPVSIPVKMPSPRSKTAPKFDGTNLREFLSEYDMHAKAAMLTSEDKGKLLMSYLSKKVKRTVEDLPEFRDGEWKKIIS